MATAKVITEQSSVAAENRSWFHKQGTLTLNFIGGPGVGKTTIIERTLDELRQRLSISVIEGDQYAGVDIDRIRLYDVPVVQILTQGGCHLTPVQVRQALDKLSVSNPEVLLIENVGDLVCPAGVDLGETVKVAVLDAVAGDDAAVKYPEVFRQSAVLIINKMDLLPYMNYDFEQLKQTALSLNPDLRIFQVSCRLGQGLYDWYDWVLHEVRRLEEWEGAEVKGAT
jgi:hydrogenase nickel incorporation protein HypB